MSRMIIGFGYKARRGKDTAADYLIQEHGFSKLSFAGHLKDIVKLAFRLTDDQLYGDDKLKPIEFWSDYMGHEVTPVWLLQRIGTELFRDQFHIDFWVLPVVREVQKRPDTNFVVADVRFANEIEALQHLGGKVYKIDGPPRSDSGRDDNHSSESSLDWFDGWDGTINNNGSIQDLYNLIEKQILRRDPFTLPMF